jgi:LacI family transcriptional regulator
MASATSPGSRKRSQIPQSKAVTLEHVAEAAGITKAAASYALTGKHEVSESTRKRVLKIAKDLGYQPNLHAQRLSSGICRGMVGLFSLDLDLGVATQMVSGLHRELHRLGFDSPVYTYGISKDSKDSQYNRELDSDAIHLLKTLCQQRPEGMICSTWRLPDNALPTLEKYQAGRGTLVTVRKETSLECDQVIFDREQNTYLAAQYLLQMEHREIGFCDFHAQELDDPRTRGFVRALNEYQLEPNHSWLFQTDSREVGGMRLAEEFIALKNRPTALCIVNDTQAATCVHQLLRAGMKIPEDVSVISLDGLAASEFGMVRLTTVTQPVEEMAFKAVKFMVERLRQGYQGTPRKVIFSGELIERESVMRLQ